MRSPRSAARGRWLVVLALISSLLSGSYVPRTALSATNLEIGGTAVIADAQGDPVRLRAEAGLHGDVIDLFPEGTVVEVLDGPFEAGDGSFWYLIEAGGDTGYMIADYLSSSASGAGIGEAVVLSALNLRAGPSTGDDILLVMPEGDVVTILGSPTDGFFPVDYAGTAGWAFGDYLSVDGAGEGPTGTAFTTSDLNLRAGPSTSDDVLLVMPEGAALEMTGSAANGFVSVDYQGTAGWAYADYLSEEGGAAIGEAVVDSALNLRAGPSTSDDVLDVMPGGAVVEILGDPENGFYPVRYGSVAGWAYGEYLLFDGEPALPSSNIIWPVSGGEWRISQGYNGFSHYNAGSTYQYHYSFDIARTDGGTAWEPVYSPVSGTIRWTEGASGGISIDLGNGYAVALFHVTLDPGWSEGDAISQGDYLGQISGPGGDGYVDGFAHVHMTLWETADGGNWSRVAVPFTGANAISGQEFPDTGAFSDWAGTIFYP